MKKTLALFLLLFTMSAQAAYVLWVDIRGDISTVNVNGTPYDFRVFMESKSNSNWDPSYGIDIVALTSSGEILTWWNEYDRIWDTFGPWVFPEGAGDSYEWSLQNQQAEVSNVQNTDTIRLLAGYFDWENMDEGIEAVDLSYYTPLAYTDSLFSLLNGTSGGDDYCYETGDLGPPHKHWTPTKWYEYGTIIPEPSTGALFLLGTAFLFRRNRASRRATIK